MSFLERADEAFPGNGQRILDVIHNVTDVESFPSVAQWIALCWHRPSDIELKMAAIDEILEGHGVEAVFGDDVEWPDMVYVNMGDTYADTVVYDYIDAKYRVTSWGAWIERAERLGRTYA
ncbi:MAG: hypothetical protein ACSLE8_06245 [Rhodococcus sp. (in: high G+C Gram-positive bacteria)]